MYVIWTHSVVPIKRNFQPTAEESYAMISNLVRLRKNADLATDMAKGKKINRLAQFFVTYKA